MNRRNLLALLGTAVWMLPARADQIRLLIGFLHASARKETAERLSAFHKGTNESGFVDGENITIGCRWADGDAARGGVRRFTLELSHAYVFGDCVQAEVRARFVPG